jgi:hypothetical protein
MARRIPSFREPKLMFVLGPFVANVVEPAPAPPPAPGRRTISFGSPATEPGGKVHLVLNPGVDGDKMPVNVYAVYADPAQVGADPTAKTPEWFLQGGFPVGFSAITDPQTGSFDVAVPNVAPGVYHVQTVLEFAE